MKSGAEFEAGTAFTLLLSHPCRSEDAFTRASDYVPERRVAGSHAHVFSFFFATGVVPRGGECTLALWVRFILKPCFGFNEAACFVLSSTTHNTCMGRGRCALPCAALSRETCWHGSLATMPITRSSTPSTTGPL